MAVLRVKRAQPNRKCDSMRESRCVSREAVSLRKSYGSELTFELGLATEMLA